MNKTFYIEIKSANGATMYNGTRMAKSLAAVVNLVSSQVKTSCVVSFFSSREDKRLGKVAYRKVVR